MKAVGTLKGDDGSALRCDVRVERSSSTPTDHGRFLGDQRQIRAATGVAVSVETVHTFPMGYYLLEYALVGDYLARRAALRDEHLALAREAHRRGDLILAGAVSEPPDRAVLVWLTDDRSVVERFTEGDPYVRHGLVTSWTIRPWTVVIGERPGLS
jgi:uncharacterized protein YciI